MKHGISLIGLILLSIPFLQAQEVDLPKGLAPHEVDLIPAYRASRAGEAKGITSPPDFAVRTMAEWEEVQALVLTWRSYPVILKQIVRHAKEEVVVHIFCSNSGQNSVASVTNYLLANNEGGEPLSDLDNVEFHVAATNSIWIRDYGPEVIYRNEVDTLMLLDWIYNRPRPDDDALSDVIASILDIPIYSTTQSPNDVVHTGGNFMMDGFGTAFSSELVLEENGPSGQFNQTPKTTEELLELMDQFMGVQEYVLMNTLPYDGIHHIDMHMKLLDEETLLVGEFPVGVSDGPQLESNLAGIASDHVSVFGSPYEHVRIPMIPSTGGNYPPNGYYRTYANAIFINGTILLPTYREEFDTTGIRIWQEAMPGYKVVGIDCDDSNANIISASGAIHCITKTIGVEDPLLIRHQRLDDTYETQNDYAVEAYIRHRSGIASARVYWTADTTQGYTPAEMSDMGNGNWIGAIPAHPAGSEIFYYIEGTANSGKVQVRPLVAPEGWWRFRVLDISSGLPDREGPSIADLYPNPTSSLLVIEVHGAGNEPVSITMTDAMGRQVMNIQQGRMHRDGRIFADLSGLSDGTYLVIVSNEHGRNVQRVVKR